MSAYLKDLFREIKKTPGRFVSLVLIALLGAASIVGIRATSIDMRAVADRTYKEHSLYDLQVKSPVGFGGDDIAALSAEAGVSEIMPTNIVDVYVSIENQNRATRTYALPGNINRVGIIDGRLPENPGECAVEPRLFFDGGIKLGDSIKLGLDDMGDYFRVLADDTFTVVGVVSSPLYITFQRGHTMLGDGSLRYYLYLHPDAYNAHKLGVFTDVYVLMEGSRDMDNLTQDYYAAADGWKSQIERTPGWFALTRREGVAFDSYYQDTLRLEKIGYVFPLVFFLVAVMVSLTSMSRLVESHRTQIGIYKALGYHPAAIMMKYLFYAFSAGLIGGTSGAALGSRVFPLIISDAYGRLYYMPPVSTPIPTDTAVMAVVAAILAVVLVTLGTYVGSMRGNPALLMRPKPPGSGKRVLLERVPFVWKRLGFFDKVAARNVFRYKRRFIMTLAGVAGCSALLLTAFGLRDSIGGVAELQYETIVKFDARAYLKDISAERQRDGLEAVLPASHLYIREEAVTASGAGGSLPASLIVPESPENLGDYFNLHSPETGEAVPMGERSVLITEKLSRVMGVGKGGTFTMALGDGSAYTAEVTGVVDNYLLHYVYMSPAVYTEIFGGEPYPNGVFVFCGNGRDFAAPLLENENVRALIYNEEIKTQVSDQTDAMDIVAVVLIVLACALAFVVLFNLTNINISERVRELATMKVLGLNDGELAMYIYRENAAVTFLGIALGLAGGVFLHSYVLTSVEIDVLKFPQIIHPPSYIAAVVLSVAFAVFVNFAMGYRLAKIDMVESLKSVE